MKKILINTETINLDKFLKWAQITSSGGEAKLLISDGLVKVNGHVETHRSKKLMIGDIIEVEGKKYEILKGAEG